jgi:hypothetical protein
VLLIVNQVGTETVLYSLVGPCIHGRAAAVAHGSVVGNEGRELKKEQVAGSSGPGSCLTLNLVVSRVQLVNLPSRGSNLLES